MMLKTASEPLAKPLARNSWRSLTPSVAFLPNLCSQTVPFLLIAVP